MAKGYIAGSRTTRARNGAVRDFKEIFMNLRRQFWLVVIPGLALLLLTVTNAEQIDGRRRSVPAVELAQAVARPKTATAAQSHQQDEKAIRANVDAMTKAFNDKDAAAIAKLFTEDAQIVDDDGQSFQGRAEIERVFGDGFEENPKSQMKGTILSIRFVTPSVAVEDGSTTIRHNDGRSDDHSRYSVVHVKQDGKWMMASAHDFPDENRESSEELAQLAGMIGDWIDESPESLTRTSYRWDEAHRYILGDFSLQVAGRISLAGSVRLGWDPLAKKIHSWVFDSKGGFAEGLWTREGNQWVTKMNGVSADGRLASATNITTLLGKGRMTWESRDRVVGDEVMPDIEKITIVRKPPQSQ